VPTVWARGGVEEEVVGQLVATLHAATLDAGACGAAARVVEEAAAAQVGGPWRRRPAAGAPSCDRTCGGSDEREPSAGED
jgi:hypothetical protein